MARRELTKLQKQRKCKTQNLFKEETKTTPWIIVLETKTSRKEIQKGGEKTGKNFVLQQLWEEGTKSHLEYFLWRPSQLKTDWALQKIPSEIVLWAQTITFHPFISAMSSYLAVNIFSISILRLKNLLTIFVMISTLRTSATPSPLGLHLLHRHWSQSCRESQALELPCSWS